MRLRPVIASVFVALTLSSAFAADLSIGSPAPPISVKTWLKGTPITGIDPAKIYVVEFWATWCAPCIESMPHVTKLAGENADVTFLGVGIWEDEKGDNLKSFVARMGDKMGYNVGYSGNKDGMAATWMEAAGQSGIPAAFIIKDAKISWIGHPMSLDKPLAEIKAGTFNAVAFKRQFEADNEASRKQVALQKEFRAIRASFEAGKRTEAKAALAKLLAAHPELKPQTDSITYGWLAVEDPKAWEIRTKELLSKTPPEAEPILNFAYESTEEPKGYPLAKRTIALVLKTIPNDFSANLYARYIYGKTGDTRLALRAVDKLLELYPTSFAKDDAQVKAELVEERTELVEKISKEKK